MTVYRFKIALAEDKKVHREIRIQANQTFKDLHHTIMKAFHLNKLSGASFFVSDKKWTKGKKIALTTPAGDNDTLTMDATKIEDFVSGKNEHFVYDCKTDNNPWTFNLEVINVEKDVDIESYRFPKWEDTSKLPLPVKKKVVAKPVVDDDDDFDDFESDDSFGKGFDDVKSKDGMEVEESTEDLDEDADFADEPYEEEEEDDER